ncbi:MAG: hypothetical protein ACLQGP_36475 [Isosphaeraceae bacterium]
MISSRPWLTTLTLLLAMVAIQSRLIAAEPIVDLSGYRSDSGVVVRQEGARLNVDWPIKGSEAGRVILDLRTGGPLIRFLGFVPKDGARPTALLEGVDPVTDLLVGSRQAPSGRPPEMSVFNVFFDTPANRPFQTTRSQLSLKRLRVTSHGHGATVAIGEVTCGAFSGELDLTFYARSPLIHVATVIHTQEDRRAILYDTGLAFSEPSKPMRFVWMDTEGKLHRDEPAPDTKDRHLAVRHRTLIAETPAGSIACFPPPHQFFFPRDLTDNLRTAWYGRDHRGIDDRFGFGIRQSEKGGGSYVPWFNAPPGTDQRLGVFYLLSSGKADEALGQVLRYTNGDRFPDLPGYHKLTSHWHMATAVAAMNEKAKSGPRTMPDLVGMFKTMGVEVVHLAEFHGDGHPQDPGPIRLAEIQAMFDECRRLSDDTLLFLPGEEANIHLGLSDAGKHPGHWEYLFPRPVYWTMKRAPGQPFVEDLAPYGRVYHVGTGADMQALLNRERGLAWTSHARIKGSSWTPDLFRHEDFYLSDRWLGAAWKAMPADLSHDRLGRRALDLLDDMANWGQKKQLLGEADVFKIDHTHELYGHMNINYVRLDPDRIPRFDESWQAVLDAIRGGRFFTTTGEVLIPEFTVKGQPSGSTVELERGEHPEVRLDLRWTFPLKFVEVISGDGSHVFRERIDCSDTYEFDKRTMRLTPDLKGRTWVRVEAWDIACNGAFTQPVWLTPRGK